LTLCHISAEDRRCGMWSELRRVVSSQPEKVQAFVAFSLIYLVFRA